MAKASFPFDMSKLTPTARDEHKTTFTHKAGHTVSVAHNVLSKPMRELITSLPLTDTNRSTEKNSNPKLTESTKQSATPELQTPPKYAQGGVAGPSPSPSDKLPGAKDFDKGFNTPTSPGEMWDNIKSGVSNAVQGKAKGGPIRKYADGGDVSPAKDDLSDLQAPQAQAPNSSSADSTTPAASDTPTIPAPQNDPIKAQQRALYNQIASGSTDPAAGQNTGASFGPNGEPPANFSPQAWAQATQMIQGNQQEQVAQEQQKVAQVMRDNKARADAGLAPIPVPDSIIKASTAGAATSSQPNTDSQQAAPTTDDPMGQGAYRSEYDQAAQQQKAGIGAEAKALGNEGAAQQGALQESQQTQQSLVDEYKKNYSTLDNERNALVNDINQQHIDPEHYMGSLSTAGKIGTGIGLILGGMGAGLTGGENPALKMLQMHINNDIEAQKQNLGTKQSLLSANLHQFGNMRDATDMTRLQMGDILKNKLQQASAMSQTPLAAARGQQSIAQVSQAQAQLHQQMAMRQTMMGLAQGVIDPNKAAQTVATLRAFGKPEDAKALEEKIVPNVGVGQIPVPEAAKQQILSAKNVNDLFNRSLEFSQQHAGSLDPRVNAQASVIQNQLIGVIKQAQHDGVYKESEASFLMKQIGGSPTSFLANLSSVPKIKELQQIKQQDYAKTLETYGIKGPGTQLQAPSTAAPQYKTDAQGVKWQRGPNGEAIRVK